ncbi:hypothetical protein AACT_0634 [Arcobacter acticola]|uniref:Lipoprotein n=1 Tax=Arcobacter acticola TaxID=1849015 RepID=A0A6M8EIU9_9BACT|nr:hypothetical protein AACT_0634 [Arcobacter acticola]
MTKEKRSQSFKMLTSFFLIFQSCWKFKSMEASQKTNLKIKLKIIDIKKGKSKKPSPFIKT